MQVSARLRPSRRNGSSGANAKARAGIPLAALLFAGCYSTAVGVVYEFDMLARVDGGPQMVARRVAAPVGAVFEDDRIVASWQVSSGPHVRLHAKGKPFVVAWRDAWIEHDGTRDEIVAACSIGPIDLQDYRQWREVNSRSAEVLTETPVGADEQLGCVLHLRRRAVFDETTGFWESPPLFDWRARGKLPPAEAERIAAADVGRRLRVALPIRQNLEWHVYEFDITLTGVDAREFRY